MRVRMAVLAVAAVVGAAGGVTTALVVAPGTDPDPLGIGAPLVDLDCTGEPVLVVGTGDNAAALRPAVLNSPPGETVRYLDTTRSCDARWTAERSTEEPRWVAYVGPADAVELCLDELTAAHRGDNVTFLRAGSEQRAECLCEVPASAAPLLEPGLDADADTAMWIRAMQSVFVTIDEARGDDGPVALTADDVTGRYDRRTRDRVDALLASNGMPRSGVADTFVWERLSRTGCKFYDFR